VTFFRLHGRFPISNREALARALQEAGQSALQNPAALDERTQLPT
jgi:hypothetical protein